MKNNERALNIRNLGNSTNSSLLISEKLLIVVKMNFLIENVDKIVFVYNILVLKRVHKIDCLNKKSEIRYGADVGSHPERPCFYDEFETYIHGFRTRLKVMPGLTGLAQVHCGYDLKPEEKIVYDVEYIKTR